MRVLLLILFLTLSVSAQTTRYVSSSGSGTACTSGSPCTLSTAVGGGASPVQAGDRVELAQGVYQLDSVTFSPAGSDKDHMTKFYAAPGARVIITATDNTIPHINTADYVWIDSLWFGGSKSVTDGESIADIGASPLSHWKWFTNCTFFGGNNGMTSGQSEYLVVQGSRFIHCGTGTFFHSLYISGPDSFPGSTGTQTQHTIVDKNIFIGQASVDGGYSVHFFHNNRTGIATRNFVTFHDGYVYDGKEALFANNMCWKCGGTGTPDGNLAFYFPATALNSVMINNVLGGPSDYFLNTNDASNTVNKNAYARSDNNSYQKGTNPISLTSGSEASQLGVSATTLDNAISALNSSFSASPSTILNDSTIETNFAVISGMTVPGGSPIQGTGQIWFGSSALNVGPNVAGPTNTITTPNDVGCWWEAFRALGLKEHDSNGNIMNSGFLSCTAGGGSMGGGPTNPRAASSTRAGSSTRAAASTRAASSTRAAIQ